MNKETEVGTIRLARQIEKTGTGKYIWASCPMCQKLHWVLYSFYLKHPENKRGLCMACSQRGNGIPTYQWKNKNGYMVSRYPSSYPYYRMRKNRQGDILVHRAVMAEYLGRCLLPTEVVHHINGVRDDNRIDNLMLMGKGEHIHMFPQYYTTRYAQGFIDGFLLKIRGIKELAP